MSYSWALRGTEITGENFGDQFGKAVAMSSDGSIIAVAGPYNDGGAQDAGSVRVFQLNGNAWVQKGADIDGTNAFQLSGSTLAMSADGNVLAIGSPKRLNIGSGGAILVYRWSGSSWALERTIGGIIPHESVLGIGSGRVIFKMSRDGKIIVYVSRISEGSNISSINGVFYNTSSSTWNTLIYDSAGGFVPNTITGIVGDIALSSNGSTIVLSTMNPAKLIIHNIVGGNTITKNTVNNYSYASPSDRFGQSLAMSPDGGVIAVGAPDAFLSGATNTGRVFLYQRNIVSSSIDTWSDIGTINAESPSDNCGTSVAMSEPADNMNLVVVLGSPRSSSNVSNGQSAGSVHVWYRTGPVNWALRGDAIDSQLENDRLGESVAISSDGSVVAVGVPQYTGLTNIGVSNGRARVYNYATVPGAPTGVTALVGASGELTVQWSAPASNGGSAITGYTVTASPGGATATTSGTSTTVTGLTNGTQYTFTVKATNAAGDSAASAPSASVTTVSVPGAPTGVTATAGVRQATVQWSAPASNGGSAISAYIVTASPDVSGSPKTVLGTETSATFTGLSTSTAYTFTVVAVNAAGSSASSTASTSVTPAGVTPTVPVVPVVPVVPCFFGNARVLTSSGYRRMDSLKVGDSVVTPQGASVSIERVKVTVCPAGPNTNPYVIPAGTFGATSRMLISPDHKVCMSDGRRVEAKKLGLAQEDREGTLTYYNLELAGCADMVVGGVAVESLAPVRRVVMSLAAFESAMKSRYGSLTPATLANIKRTCRLVGKDAVEVPVVRR